MTGTQFELAIARLGLSQAEAARLLRSEKRTIERYISGDRHVPGPVSAFLDYLKATGKSGASALKKLGD